MPRHAGIIAFNNVFLTRPVFGFFTLFHPPGVKFHGDICDRYRRKRAFSLGTPSRFVFAEGLANGFFNSFDGEKRCCLIILHTLNTFVLIMSDGLNRP